MAERVTILDFRNGEWHVRFPPGFPPKEREIVRLQDAMRDGKKPKDIGMKRVGPWRENTWPEGSREAEYEL